MRSWLWLAMAGLAFASSAQQVTPQPIFRIRGTVVNALNGEPVPKALVTIAPVTARDATRSVRSDARGAFRFDNVPAGKYALDARARGFPPQGFDQHENYSSAIAAGPDKISEGLVFRLQPGATISGTIIDGFNEVVRNAEVRLFRAGLESGSYGIHQVGGTSTDDQGSYYFDHLRPGQYYIAVIAEPWYAQAPRARGMGYVAGRGSPVPAAAAPPPDPSLDVTYPVTYFGNATDASAAAPITLKAGDSVTADVTLQAVPAVHLRIKLPEGKPGQGAFPTLTQRVFGGAMMGVRTRSSATTAGTFEIDGLAPGHYEMRVEEVSEKGRVSHSSATREIDVTGDSEIDATEGAPGPRITGKVTFPGSAAPTRALLLLRNRRSGEQAEAEITPNGEFTIEQGIAPGIYDLDIALLNAGAGRPLVVRSVAAVGAKVIGPAIEIGNRAGIVRLQVTTTAELGRVDGVALQEGKPVSGAMIVLVPQAGTDSLAWVRRDQSDSDGTFTLANIVPGNYTVVAIRNGWDLSWATPAVLKTYLTGGQAVRVEPRGEYKVKVDVQEAR